MAGPNLPTNIDTTDHAGLTVDAHEQHHDSLHRVANHFDMTELEAVSTTGYVLGRVGGLFAPVPPVPGIPAGGATGQVLTKSSGADYNAGWVTPSSGGGGGAGLVNTITGLVSIADDATLVDKQTAGATNKALFDAQRAGLAGQWVTFAPPATAGHVYPIHGNGDLSGVRGVWFAPGARLQQTRNPTSSGTSGYCLFFRGTWNGTKRTLTADTVPYSRTITVNDATGIVDGSRLDIWDPSSVIRSTKYAACQSVTVIGVSGATLTLDRPLRRTYTAATGQVLLVTPLGPIDVLNPDLSHADPVNAGDFYHDLIRAEFVDGFTVRGGDLGPGPGRGVHLAGVRGFLIDTHIHDLLDGTYGGVTHLGYGVEAGFTTCDGEVRGRVERTRHAFTTNVSPDLGSTPSFFGGNTIGDPCNIRVAPLVLNTTSTGIDTHENGWNIELVAGLGGPGTVGAAAMTGDTGTGSLPLAVNVRCDEATVTGRIYGGPAGGLQIDHSTQSHNRLMRVTLRDLTIYGAGLGNGTMYAVDAPARTTGESVVVVDNVRVLGAKRPVSTGLRTWEGTGLRIEADGQTGLSQAFRMDNTRSGNGFLNLRDCYIDPAYPTGVLLNSEPPGQHRVQAEPDTIVQRKWTGSAFEARNGKYLIPAGMARWIGGTTVPPEMALGDTWLKSGTDAGLGTPGLLNATAYILGAPASTIYDTAAADWVAADYDGTATTWADRIGAKTFALNGTNPPTWNPLLQSFDFDGVNDYIETADHTDFDIGASQDFTVAIALEPLTPGVTAKAIITKKNSYLNTSGGWALRTSAAGALEFLASDGTTQAAATLTMPTVSATVGVRCASDVAVAFVEGNVSGNASLAAVGALTNTQPLRICATSATTPGNFGPFRIFRVTIWRSAVTLP